MEWSVNNALLRLGDKYEPAFKDIEGSWKRIAYLKPKLPQRKKGQNFMSSELANYCYTNF